MTPAAMVGMRDSYRSFQAEKIGQYALELGVRELESPHHWFAIKVSPAALPSPSTFRKRSPSLALLYAIRKARSLRPSESTRDFRTAGQRSLSAMRAACLTTTSASLPPD